MHYVVNLVLQDSVSWTEHNGTHVRGTAFDGDRFLPSAELAAMFAATGDAAEFVSLLGRLNGYFAVVQLTEQGCRFAVDRVRSIPLFYGLNGNELVVGDDAERIKKQLPDTSLDALSVKEFMLTGYVTGGDTLFPNIKQVMAGECAWTATAASEPILTTRRYYQWICGDYFEASHDELCAEMQRMYEMVFKRLLISTKGRTLVVPLSGGYDSRLIAIMLKRLGCEDVICFSYGRPGNWESEISRRLAHTLGYRWLFVPYGRRQWRRWSRLEQWSAYMHMSGGFCSYPPIQDWPAIFTLKLQSSLPNNAVIVPGHTATLANQTNTVDKLSRKTPLRGNDMYLQTLWSCHYNLWKVGDGLLRKLFAEKNLLAVEGLPMDTPEEVAGCLDFWAWRERHAKYIINSVRVYEFFGYDWAMPLWDNEIMSFWRRVHFHDRVKKALYCQSVHNLFRQMGIHFEHPVYRNIAGRIIAKLTKWQNPFLGQFGVKDYRKTRAFYNRQYPVSLRQSLCSSLNFLTLGTYSYLGTCFEKCELIL